MVGMILMVMGFLLVSFHLYIPSSHFHPNYIQTDELGNVIQTFVIENMLKGRLNYGVVVDVLGYLLLLAGGAVLLKHGVGFLYGQLFALTSLVLRILLAAIPFYMNGRQLTVSALSISFFLMVTHVLMGYFMIYAITGATLNLKNEANVRYVKMGFIGASICHVVRYFLVLSGLNTLSIIYQFAILGFMAFCLYNVCKLTEGLPGYGGKEKPSEETP